MITVAEFTELCNEHEVETCRVCGEPVPRDPDADYCPGCADEPPCGDPRPDPRTHPEYWTE